MTPWKKVPFARTGYYIEQPQFIGLPRACIYLKSGNVVPYVTFANGVADKAEGALSIGLDHEAEAEAALKQTVEDYLKDKPGTVYWRKFPEVTRNAGDDKWVARCRLLITTKDVDKWII